MNFGTLVKVFDTAVALGSMASRTMGSSQGTRTTPASAPAKAPATSPAATTDALETQPPPPGVRGYLETRLANVLVVALKEAFDRDHARLELERGEQQDPSDREHCTRGARGLGGAKSEHQH